MPKCCKKKKVKDPVREKPIEDFKSKLEYDHHTIPLEDLYARFETDPENGLTHAVAKRKLEENGSNVLSSFKRQSRIALFFKYFFGYYSLFVWLGLLCSLFAYNRKDPAYLTMGVINIVILAIACIILSAQESQNTKLIESFKLLVPEFATVIRQGEKLTLRVEDIVLGDLISLKFGDRVPADIRIIEAKHFKVDISLITNETEPGIRGPENTNVNPLEAKNVVFFSSPVLEGYAQGIAISCGDDTHIGRIAGLTCSLVDRINPITHDLTAVVHIVTVFGFIQATFIVLLNIKKKVDTTDIILLLGGMFFGLAPHVLLITIAICLHVVAKRMDSKKCFIKKFQSLETLGTASIICFDKTGILTKNLMSVAHIWCDDTIFSANMQDALLKSDAFLKLARVSILCNRAEIKSGQEEIAINKKEVSGDATEAGLIKYMETTVGDVMLVRKHNPKLAEIPFNRTNKFQLSIHKDLMGETHQFFLVMKGAPERVLERCSNILVNNRVEPLTDEWREKYIQAFATLGNMGERVLALCDYDFPTDEFPPTYEFRSDNINFPTNGFCCIGLISLVDPPRPDIRTAIQQCRNAGIRLVMVSGDDAMAAKAFATDVGIISGDAQVIYDTSNRTKYTLEPIRLPGHTSAVVLGNNPMNLRPEILDEIFLSYTEVVFARTPAQHKLGIVECCQRYGDIVAVTGIGINDSPALKKAHISASLGRSGSHVCKEVADVILLDDSFNSLVAAIRESRLCFNNLKKTIAYSLTSNVAQVVPFLFAFLLDMPWPLNLYSGVCIKVGTDLMPALSLIFEQEDEDMMSVPPRNPFTEHIVSARLISLTQGQIGMIQAAAAMFAFFAVMAMNGFKPKRLMGIRSEWDDVSINDLRDSHGNMWSFELRKELERLAQTSVFVSIVVVQWVDLIICRTQVKSIFQIGMRNHLLNGALLIETILAVIFIYCPQVQDFLQLSPIPLMYWLFAVPFGLLIFFYDEMRRFIVRRKPGGWLDRETTF